MRDLAIDFWSFEVARKLAVKLGKTPEETAAIVKEQGTAKAIRKVMELPKPEKDYHDLIISVRVRAGASGNPSARP
jgi:hypothetical protein